MSCPSITIVSMEPSLFLPVKFLLFGRVEVLAYKLSILKLASWALVNSATISKIKIQ
jgi:hypothetical protein